MKFSYSSVTSSGPRAVNEDAIGIWAIDGGRFLAAVADGLGGMGGGAQASAAAIECLSAAVAEGSLDPTDLKELFQAIHGEIRERQDEHPASSSMATTLSAVLLENSSLWGAHCGDTRVMVARGNGIKRLSRDHSEAQRFLEQGKLSRSEYLDYPRKNILYSALGSNKELVVQTFEFAVQERDWIILTSDGVHQCVSTKEFRDLGLESSSAEDYIARLVDLLGFKVISDNYSAVVIRVE